MKYLTTLALALAIARATPVKRDAPQGIDVSNDQGEVDWNSVAANGILFAYIEATEGTFYTSPSFNDQYNGAANAGIIRGAYHVAHPDQNSGADQANFFLTNGGFWIPDAITLPGVLDIEPNPNGDFCYDLSTDDMVSWITDFSNAYQYATSRYPVIYTTTSWWNTCTGNDGDFAANNPLWIADWESQLGPLPAGWDSYSFWQYSGDASPNPGDADVWNGDYSSLQAFAFSS